MPKNVQTTAQSCSCHILARLSSKSFKLSFNNQEFPDVFLEFSCFLYDPTNVGNSISGSSILSKPSLYIWKFLVRILLKSSLRDFEHNLTGLWNEHNCTVAGAFFGIVLLWDWNENSPFPVLWPLLSFPQLLAYWKCSTLTASSFRIWNSSAGIPLPPLALFRTNAF